MFINYHTCDWCKCKIENGVSHLKLNNHIKPSMGSEGIGANHVILDLCNKCTNEIEHMLKEKTGRGWVVDTFRKDDDVPKKKKKGRVLGVF